MFPSADKCYESAIIFPGGLGLFPNCQKVTTPAFVIIVLMCLIGQQPVLIHGSLSRGEGEEPDPTLQTNNKLNFLITSAEPQTGLLCDHY